MPNSRSRRNTSSLPIGYSPRRRAIGQSVRVGLAFDGSPQVRSVTCTSCGREYSLVTAFVTKDSVATAIVYVACHAHDEHAEAWMDVAFDSFEEPDFADQATFSCRV